MGRGGGEERRRRERKKKEKNGVEGRDWPSLTSLSEINHLCIVPSGTLIVCGGEGLGLQVSSFR